MKEIIFDRPKHVSTDTQFFKGAYGIRRMRQHILYQTGERILTHEDGSKSAFPIFKRTRINHNIELKASR